MKFPAGFRMIARRGFSDQRVKELEQQILDLTSKLEIAQKQKSTFGGIKAIFAERGIPFFVWYFFVWAGGIGGFYGLLKMNAIS